MASNSFNIKAWTIAVVSTALALTTREGVVGAMLGLVVVTAFWGLDAHYLRQERLFRQLFDAVRRGDVVDHFDMNTQDYEQFVQNWVGTLFSRTIISFYGPVLIAVAGIASYFIFHPVIKGNA